MISCCIGGCRAVDHAQVDVLERELRQQEDYIYELEDYLIEYSEKLRQCRMACQGTMSVAPSSSKAPPETGEPTLADDAPRGASSRRPAGRGGGPIVAPPPGRGATPPPTDRLPPPETAAEPEPAAESPAAPVQPDEMEAPELDIGPTSDLQWESAPMATSPAPAVGPPGDEAPPYLPDPADYQLDVDPPVATAPELTSAEPQLPPPADPARLAAARLVIRQLFAEPPVPEAGPEAPAAGSLLVVVEALNATDEPVDAGGPVSLMVMAGEEPESLVRVDRWDFTAEETQASWQSSQLGDGMHLELPLGRGPLPDGPLELWARVVGPEGQKLLARLPFNAGELTSFADRASDGAASDDPSPPSSPIAADGRAPAVTSAAAETPSTGWRASLEPLGAAAIPGSSTAAPGRRGGWTSQPPGGRTLRPAEPRAGSGAPRWQHRATGSAEASPETAGAWAPLR